MNDKDLTALATFGESFGVLFQIVDDLMDVLSTADLWGKAMQHDVRQGVFTLPVLLAAQAPGSGLAQVLVPDPPAASVSVVYETVRELAGATAVAAAYEWADRARDALLTLPGATSRDDLAALPERYTTAVFASRVATRHRPIVDRYLRSVA